MDLVRRERLTRPLVLAIVVVGIVAGVGIQSAQAQSGTVYRWGGYKSAGVYVPEHQARPTVVPGLSDVTALAAANSANYALLSNGQEWAWGNNGNGQLGNGSKAPDLLSPVRVLFPPGVVITAIGEADQMAYAVDSQGRGWSWGWNGRGALCLGDHRIRATPTLVPGLSNLVAVAGGGGSVVWLTASGVVYTCGTQLTGTDTTPARVKGLPPGDPAVAISAGNSYSTVRLASGQIWDWGLGGSGQLGNGVRQNSSTPVRVLLPSGTSATQVYSGGDLANDGHQLAVLNTGAVVAWGSNICGQLGAGHPGTQSAPVTVHVLQGMSVAMVASGGSTSYVLDNSGNLWAWGADGGGQVRQPVRRCVGKPNKVDTGVDLVSATASDVVDYHG